MTSGMRAARLLLPLALALPLTACASNEAETSSATVTISFGKAGPPVVEPPPSKVVVTAKMSTGETRDIGTYGWPPPSSINLSVTAGEAMLLNLAAVTDAGTIPLRGETPFVEAEELVENRVVLLVGPTSGFVTTPQALPRGLADAKGTLVLGRYALGAEAVSTVVFDSATYATRTFQDLPVPASTMAAWTPSVVAIVGPSSAGLLDVTNGANGAFDASAADLGGCKAVLGADGAYLVGPTRVTGSTQILALRTAQALVTVPMRAGASAAWVNEIGLVVGGGDGDTVDVLAAGATTLSTKITGLEPTPLGIVAPLGNQSAALVGGGKKTRLLSLSCQADCVKTIDETVDVKNGEAFQVGNSAFVFGEDATGHAKAVLLRQDGSTKALPLAVPRKGAVAVPLGDGYVVVMGGVDDAGAAVTDVEMFTPP